MMKKCFDQNNDSREPRLILADNGTLYLDQITKSCKGRHQSLPYSLLSSPTSDSIPLSLTVDLARLGPLLTRSVSTPKESEIVTTFTDSSSPTKSTEQKNEGKDSRNTSGYEDWSELIILIPVRLGLQKFNQQYIPSLLKCLEFPQSLGFIGGRPRASLYFIGHQDDRVFYMDPHTVQPSSGLDDDIDVYSVSYHTSDVYSMRIHDIDPSLALGFYCRSYHDFCDFWERVKKMVSESKFPVFQTADVTPSYVFDDITGSDSEDEKKINKKKFRFITFFFTVRFFLSIFFFFYIFFDFFFLYFFILHFFNLIIALFLNRSCDSISFCGLCGSEGSRQTNQFISVFLSPKAFSLSYLQFLK